MFVAILCFLFCLFNLTNGGAMIHASDYSKIPANVSLIDSENRPWLHYYDKDSTGSNSFGLIVVLWHSNRLCSLTEASNTHIQFQFEIQSKASTCVFTIDKPQGTDRDGKYDIRIMSNIRGNKQSYNYYLKKIVDWEAFAWMSIKNNGYVMVNGETTELRCTPGFFNNVNYIQVLASESTRCRFAVVMETVLVSDVNRSVEANTTAKLKQYYSDEFTLLITFSAMLFIIILCSSW